MITYKSVELEYKTFQIPAKFSVAQIYIHSCL